MALVRRWQVLSRVGVSEVSEEVLGFAEMATMRIGSLLDQPRMVRMQALQSDRAKKKQLEESRAKQAVQAAALHASQVSIDAHEGRCTTVRQNEQVPAARAPRPEG